MEVIGLLVGDLVSPVCGGVLVGSEVGSTVGVEGVGLKICKENVTLLTVGVEVVGF